MTCLTRSTGTLEAEVPNSSRWAEAADFGIASVVFIRSCLKRHHQWVGSEGVQSGARIVCYERHASTRFH